jgi:hypothetical protein
MFRDGDTPIAKTVGKLRLRHHVGIEPVAAIPRIGIVGGKEVIEFHREIRAGRLLVVYRPMLSENDLFEKRIFSPIMFGITELRP